jgi:Domain of unknown function (DUF4437)
MKKTIPLFVLFLSIACFALAQSSSMPAGAADHIALNSTDLKWQQSEFPGVMVAVADGDPSKEGAAFSIYLKFPANFKFPAHYHPTDESLVVVKGALGVGVGDKMDPKSGMMLTAGAFGKMNKEVHHYAWTGKMGATIALYGTGPFATTFVNPADDPRKKP